jgi:serine/threonine-protein kinase
VSEQPAPPRDFAPDIPEALEDVIMRCLEKDPDDRFQDIVALRAALREIVFDVPWSFERANDWWNCKGCPQRKAMAQQALEAAAV